MVLTRRMAKMQAARNGSSNLGDIAVAPVEAMDNYVVPAVNAAIYEEAAESAVEARAAAQRSNLESNGALNTHIHIENESISTGPSAVETIQNVFARPEDRGEKSEGQPRLSPPATAQASEAFLEIIYPQTTIAQNNDGEHSSELPSAHPSPAAVAVKEAHAEKKKPRRRRGTHWTRKKSQKSKAKANAPAEHDEVVEIDDIINPTHTCLEDDIMETVKEEQRPTKCLPRAAAKAAEIADAVRQAEDKVRRNKGKAKEVELPTTKEAATGSKRRRNEKEVDVDDITQPPLDPSSSRRTTRRVRQKVRAPPAAEPAAQVDDSNVRQHRIIIPAELLKTGVAKRKERTPDASEDTTEPPQKRCRFDEPANPLASFQTATSYVTIARLRPASFTPAPASPTRVKLEETTPVLFNQNVIYSSSLTVPENNRPPSDSFTTSPHKTVEQLAPFPFLRGVASSETEAMEQVEPTVSIHDTASTFTKADFMEVEHSFFDPIVISSDETLEELAPDPSVPELLPLPLRTSLELLEPSCIHKNVAASMLHTMVTEMEMDIPMQDAFETPLPSRVTSDEIKTIAPEFNAVATVPPLELEEFDTQVSHGDVFMDAGDEVETREVHDETAIGTDDGPTRTTVDQLIEELEIPLSLAVPPAELVDEVQDKADESSSDAAEGPWTSGILSIFSQPERLWTGITERLSFGRRAGPGTPPSRPASPAVPVVPDTLATPPPPAPLVGLTGRSPTPPSEPSRLYLSNLALSRRRPINDEPIIDMPYSYAAQPRPATRPTRARSMAPEPSDDLIQALRAGKVSGCSSPIQSDYDFEE